MREHAITILEYVAAKIGGKETYSAADHREAGVDILGGCQRCHASIASYNAYPSTSGYWRWADCIGDEGFASAEEFESFENRAL